METRLLIFVVFLFALGAGLIAGLRNWLPAARQINGLWRLYALQVVIAACVLLPIYFGGVIYLLALLLLAARLQFEFLRLHDEASTGPLAYFAYLVASGAVVVAFYGAPAIAAAILLAGCAAIVAVSTVTSVGAGPRHGAWPLPASLVFPIPLVAHLALFERLEHGFLWLAVIYIIVEVNDSTAFILGKVFGMRKVLPRLSPNKTVAGFVSGFIGALIAGLLASMILLSLSVAQAIGLVAIVVLGGHIGDLMTSAMKRRRGKKDFPALSKDHGGALDIYDSLLVAAPFFLAYHFWVLR